jgi:hypothetical protein
VSVTALLQEQTALVTDAAVEPEEQIGCSLDMKAAQDAFSASCPKASA